MRRLLFLACLAFSTCPFATAIAEDIGNDTVCFVPGPDDCALVAATEIAKAQKTLDVQEFQLTEPHVAQAILDAKNRGIAVRLLLDKKAPGERNGQTPTLAAAGIPAWVDFHPNIAHNKVIIVDDEAVIGGSFNITTNADHHNAENMTILRDAGWTQAYRENFESRLAASEPLDQYEAEHQK
jgi:phosphatidylserine/phosphatidylglycerophosphate/cardiolipin synthase-like enzyme